ncbi:ATP-binding protein [Dokdonella koreensis]|uniref:ATP-binding protein n=1 Tax=Dokdonella koreensis TaxID=323415 RepID=UPI001CBAE8CE|nr:ATP-binding protein [Dokdonella koreensis]
MDVDYDKLNLAFSPSAPITSEEFFLGRFDQLIKAVDAISERGQHFVVHGERGVGKTSFANIVATKIENVVVAKVTCSRGESFQDLWRKALSRVRFTKSVRGTGFTAQVSEEIVQLDMFLPSDGGFDSLDIQSIFESVNGHLLFIFDEFDSVADEAVRAKFADIIKNLSDNSPLVTIALVGIADDVSGLIGQHPSIERCLKQIRLPRMSREELEQIIDKGLAILGLGMEPAVKAKIIYFSSGFPHFTHLLSKNASSVCILNGDSIIRDHHYRSALDGALNDVSQSILHSYQLATIDVKKKKSKFEDVIAACAIAAHDDYSTFAIKDLIVPYRRLTGQQVKANDLVYNVRKLCEPERGSILSRIGDSRNIRFRFSSPLMKVFVSMKLDKERHNQQQGLFVH